MSFQSFVTEKLQQITLALNAITANAKRIEELPEQIILDPHSKFHVSKDGVSESLEIQKIISAVNQGAYNRLISIDGELYLDENELKVPPLQGSINNIIYSTLVENTLPIPLSETGKIRRDIIVLNTASQIIRIAGPERIGIAVRPNIPFNTVLVTELLISDSTIGDPTDPEIGVFYISKAEKGEQIFATSGAYGPIAFLQKTTIRFTNNTTQITGMSFVGDEGAIYDGIIFTYINSGTVNLTLKNNAAGDFVKFFNNAAGDIIIPPSGIAQFRYSAGQNRLELLSVGTQNLESVLTTGNTTTKTAEFIAAGSHSTVAGNGVFTQANTGNEYVGIRSNMIQIAKGAGTLNVAAPSTGFNGNRSQIFQDKTGSIALLTDIYDNINGLNLIANQAAQEVYLQNGSGQTLATLNVAFLNNEGTTFFYNDVTEMLELRNDAGEILSEVPVSAFVSNLAKSIAFNGGNPFLLELRDTEGHPISSVTLSIGNITGLQSYLNGIDDVNLAQYNSINTIQANKVDTNGGNAIPGSIWNIVSVQSNGLGGVPYEDNPAAVGDISLIMARSLNTSKWIPANAISVKTFLGLNQVMNEQQVVSGGFPGWGGNLIRIGWDGSQLKAMVDSVQIGTIFTSTNPDPGTVRTTGDQTVQGVKIFENQLRSTNSMVSPVFRTIANPNATASRSWSVQGDSQAYGDFAISRQINNSSGPYVPEMYCNLDGNWGIGTTNPTVKLDIVGNIKSSSEVSSSSVRTGVLVFGNTAGNPNTREWIIIPNYSFNGTLDTIVRIDQNSPNFLALTVHPDGTYYYQKPVSVPPALTNDHAVNLGQVILKKDFAWTNITPTNLPGTFTVNAFRFCVKENTFILDINITQTGLGSTNADVVIGTIPSGILDPEKYIRISLTDYEISIKGLVGCYIQDNVVHIRVQDVSYEPTANVYRLRAPLPNALLS